MNKVYMVIVENVPEFKARELANVVQLCVSSGVEVNLVVSNQLPPNVRYLMQDTKCKREW